jgi:predicted CXXCH cytochrome family protein
MRNGRTTIGTTALRLAGIHAGHGRSLGAAFLLFAVGLCPWAAPRGAQAQDSVVGSLHDLSASGPGRIHALDEEQVCIFCHAPHNATGQAPLWNRHMPPTHYRIYESSTTDARIDQPSGPSKMCLSCHDGSLALGLVASRPPLEPIVMSQRTIPPGPTNLQHDLSDDHPIGFRYDRALAFRDRQLKVPDVVSRELPMGKHGEVHCTTCHDPHNNRLGDFLREPKLRSAICLSCHQLHGWDISAHARSAAATPGRSVDPREKMPYNTVADNACTNCHKIHGAEQHERLLRFRREEQNCLNCHNGSVARTNISGEVRKRSGHLVELYTGIHDAAEDPRIGQRHVECVDCHNPHAANVGRSAIVGRPSLGEVDESLRWVSGIDRGGMPVENARLEYEVCFKCHADAVARPRITDISRQVSQTNTRLEFQTVNPSFHPVIGPRNSNDVVSLISPWRASSMMRCTDCHNSDQAGNRLTAQGPHGSIYAPLLIDNYTTSDYTTESPRAYALCYRCHDRNSILGDQSFPLHNRHIVRGRAPCSACHDAHGISRVQGNSTNHSNLINFDISIVTPASGGLGSRITYEDQGPRRGSCTLTCHGVTHVDFEYGH